MEQHPPETPRATDGATDGAAPAVPSERTRLLVLVRHGQATFNLDGRHPGQLPGVPLTQEGVRQAYSAAVALAALPLSAVVSSPLERARETAEVIARGWALPVRLDARLMDTDVGPYAGKTGKEVSDDPAWKHFLAHPDEPPPGVESLAAVRQRALEAIEALLRDDTLGDCVVITTHADIVKLVVGHYLGVALDRARFLAVGNASISALAFRGDGPPEVLAVNWQAAPRWLVGPAPGATEPAPSAAPAEPPADAPSAAASATTDPTPSA